jgi:anti-anti-sigma factor
MPAPQGLNLYRHDRGTRTTITLAGEIDLDTAPPVRVMIEDCLRGGIRTIDIDLTALGFCDVSGLNVFLSAAERATEAGAALSLHHPRPNLTRLLDLTGAGFLLAALPVATLPVVPKRACRPRDEPRNHSGARAPALGPAGRGGGE